MRFRGLGVTQLLSARSGASSATAARCTCGACVRPRARPACNSRARPTPVFGPCGERHAARPAPSGGAWPSPVGADLGHSTARASSCARTTASSSSTPSSARDQPRACAPSSSPPPARQSSASAPPHRGSAGAAPADDGLPPSGSVREPRAARRRLRPARSPSSTAADGRLQAVGKSIPGQITHFLRRLHYPSSSAARCTRVHRASTSSPYPPSSTETSGRSPASATAWRVIQS